MASVRDGLERMAALFRERGKVAKRLLAIDRELAGIGEGLTGVTKRRSSWPAASCETARGDEMCDGSCAARCRRTLSCDQGQGGNRGD